MMPKATIKCNKCNQRMKVPLDKGVVNVTCPKCATVFSFNPQDYKPNPDDFALTQVDIDFYNIYEKKRVSAEQGNNDANSFSGNIFARFIGFIVLVMCFIKWPALTFQACFMLLIIHMIFFVIAFAMRDPFSKPSPSRTNTIMGALFLFMSNFLSYISGSLFVIFGIIEKRREKKKLIASQQYLITNEVKFNALTPRMSDYNIQIKEYNQYLALQKKILEERLKKEEEEKRRHREFWNSLNGYQFEREVASYFQKQGYAVISIGGSGDEGIDMILNEKIIVQCKAHSKPIGRPDFQKLYGVLKDKEAKYEKAIMVCLNGVSEHAKRFIVGKNIKIITVDEIIGNLPSLLNKEEIELK